MTEPVTYTKVGPVAWLTIDRPDARNALNQAVREGLMAGMRRFEDDANAAVLVLTGTGDRAFSAGGDLKEMAEQELAVPASDYVPIPGRNVEVSKPTIAAVNGVAFAGGFLLAQGCDLCIAADHARFAVTEVKVGRGAPWAVPLPWLVAPRVAMEILLTGDPVDAQRAYELGFVNRVMPYDELNDTAQAMGEQIARNAPLSVAAARRTVHLAMAAAHEQAYREADALWEPVYRSRDAQEGPSAFREKRAPQWSGS
ncbi:MAG: enoyl-CoA hydratase/isomerase family protein [Streptosporangiales bacterium]|nr:enoyl-CoA hydratase/isomerase family protein [Streptosporangiales bacterium]